MPQSLWVALCLSFASHSLASNSITISLAPRAANAPVSSPLLSSFAGFGIEPSNLFAYTGGDEPNYLSLQLLRNLADYSGAPPHIRIGGNTQDYILYDKNHTDYFWQWNADSTAQGVIAADAIIIGPAYFKALDRFPTGTPITFGLNLAYSAPDHVEQLVTTAQAVVDSLRNVKLFSFEIGNEPDLYLQNMMRSGAWDGQAYTKQFLDRAEAVYNRVLEPAGIPPNFFEPTSTASTIGNTFEIFQLINSGLMDGVNGQQYMSSWNQHDYFYFIGVTGTPLTLDDLMDLDYTNRQFAYWEKQVDMGLKTGLPYVLREMSSVGPIGMDGVSNTFGAALWTLNFFLYAATLDISSVQMHMTDNSHAAAWQPTNLDGNGPFVRPQYYAHAAIAQIVGNGNGSTQIGPLKTDNAGGSYKGRVRAYSAYAYGHLRAVILINARQANESSEDKDAFIFDLDLGKENANKDIFISYLTADGADSLSGTTFNGMSYSNDDGKASLVDETIYTARTSPSGLVSITVRDSQAVIANIGWLLGSTEVRNEGSAEWTRQSRSAGPTAASPNTAAWTAAATTTLAWATSAGDGPTNEAGGRKKGVGNVQRIGMRWMLLFGSLTLVSIVFFIFG